MDDLDGAAGAAARPVLLAVLLAAALAVLAAFGRMA
jgi:hypothetical protein